MQHVIKGLQTGSKELFCNSLIPSSHLIVTMNLELYESLLIQEIDKISLVRARTFCI